MKHGLQVGEEGRGKKERRDENSLFSKDKCLLGTNEVSDPVLGT